MGGCWWGAHGTASRAAGICTTGRSCRWCSLSRGCLRRRACHSVLAEHVDRLQVRVQNSMSHRAICRSD
jgi:hypothetical protein